MTTCSIWYANGLPCICVHSHASSFLFLSESRERARMFPSQIEFRKLLKLVGVNEGKPMWSCVRFHRHNSFRTQECKRRNSDWLHGGISTIGTAITIGTNHLVAKLADGCLTHALVLVQSPVQRRVRGLFALPAHRNDAGRCQVARLATSQGASSPMLRICKFMPVCNHGVSVYMSSSIGGKEKTFVELATGSAGCGRLGSDQVRPRVC